MDQKLFSVRTVAGVKYLIINRGSKVAVADENGNNYGAWYDEGSFLAALKEENPCKLQALPLGTCELLLRVTGQRP